MELTLEITAKCNLECPWCSSSSSPKGRDVPYEEIIHHMDTDGSDTIRLSGGEPVLHKDFKRILEKARVKFKEVVLLTSGNFEFDIRYPGWWEVDKYYVHVCNYKSLLYVAALRDALEKNINMQVVMVKGNEYIVGKAISYSMHWNIPIRLLYLQKQGRGINCESLELISWTCDKGCNKDEKITVTHDGKVVTCSALKYQDTCPLECLIG